MLQLPFYFLLRRKKLQDVNSELWKLISEEKSHEFWNCEKIIR